MNQETYHPPFGNFSELIEEPEIETVEIFGPESPSLSPSPRTILVAEREQAAQEGLEEQARVPAAVIVDKTTLNFKVKDFVITVQELEPEDLLKREYDFNTETYGEIVVPYEWAPSMLFSPYISDKASKTGQKNRERKKELDNLKNDSKREKVFELFLEFMTDSQ